jgi:hypothetical protein
MKALGTDVVKLDMDIKEETEEKDGEVARERIYVSTATSEGPGWSMIFMGGVPDWKKVKKEEKVVKRTPVTKDEEE